jgi:hypothetical protein
LHLPAQARLQGFLLIDSRYKKVKYHRVLPWQND